MAYQKKNKPRIYTGKGYSLPPKIMSYQERLGFNNKMSERIRTIGLVISDANGVHLTDVCKKSRKGAVTILRQIIHKIARDLTGAPLWLIGYEIGEKDHCTVLHSIKVINNYLDTKNKFATKLYEDALRVARGYSENFQVLNPILDPQFMHGVIHCPQLGAPYKEF